MCQTLKHRSCDVRDAGRTTLVKMAGALGPKYLQHIIKEMKAMLTRGYMVQLECVYCITCACTCMYIVHIRTCTVHTSQYTMPYMYIVCVPVSHFIVPEHEYTYMYMHGALIYM